MLYLLCTLSWGGEFRDSLKVAKKSLLEKDFDSMETELNKAYSTVLKLKRIAFPKEIVLLYHYRALAEHIQKRDPMPLWRKAFALHPTFEWDNVIDDREALETFYLIQGEIEQSTRVATFIPNKKGRAKTYVDGVARDDTKKVPKGEHLLQIECPKGEIFAKWSSLEEDPQWLNMCPYEIDVNDVEDDPFALDSGDLDMPQEDHIEENVEEYSSPEEKKYSLSGNDSMKGLEIETIKAKDHLLIGGSLGYQTNTGVSLSAVYVALEGIYRKKEAMINGAWEVELTLGTTSAVGGNIVTPLGLVIGPYAGMQYYAPEQGFYGLVGARLRYDLEIDDQLEAYTRLESHHVFTSMGDILFTGQIGMRYKIF